MFKMADAVIHRCNHVIFDLDGLLLDTESIYTEIFQVLLKQYGKEFTMAIKVKMMGKSELAAIKFLLEELGLTYVDPKDFLAQSKSKKVELFPTAKLLPGAERLIRHLHSHRIPMAVATGSATYEFNLKVKNHSEIISLMSHVVRSDDPEVKQGKPNPDIFQVAASRFKPSPSTPQDVLVFEDAPNGVKAAKSAGMNVVMVPEVYVDKALCTQADQVLTSLVDFDPSLWGLPAFQ